MSSGNSLNPNRRIAGSYRDPSGYVFSRAGHIYRAIDDGCQQVLRGLADEGLLAKLVERGLLVQTDFVTEGGLLETLRNEHAGYQHFLEHEVLDTITYPYEWSVSMLADAGIHTLDLQMELLASGCSLKDASAYNVQFVRGRPKFIDVASIERPRRLDVWFALGQFTQMFLFPLLLCRYRGWDLRSYFLGQPGGRPVEEVARCFGPLGRLRPRLLMDLTLPLWLQRWADKGHRTQRETLDKSKPDSRPQVLNLKRLRRKLGKLAAGYRPGGTWAEYTPICSYDRAAEHAKQTFVQEFLESTQPRRVLDLGCNTGDYSRLAAERGADVLAVDADHDAVEILYRRLSENPAPIHPMVVDLANPSPGVGYLNRERAPFFERAGAECVLALALMHHLMISANLSLEAVRDLMAEMTDRDLVLEFVPPDDAMFRRLMKFRVDLFGGLTLDACRSVFLERFELLKEAPIPDSKRTLLFLRKVSNRAASA